MRLWSIHFSYLDSKGLVALWREALLARKVLQNKTKGYRLHPQLIRFRDCKKPILNINLYLKEVFSEAEKRGYTFDKRKLSTSKGKGEMQVSRAQLNYEFAHLLGKLEKRDAKRYQLLRNCTMPKKNPLFSIKKGGIAEWEIQKNNKI